MRNFLIILSITFWGLSGCGQKMLNLQMMKDWKIVVSQNPGKSELYAATEFQTLFNQATGYQLDIMTYTETADHNIFIGHSRVMEKSTIGFSVLDFGEEELQIAITMENIVIAGGKPRGTLYGVYEFFERYLGVRFLTKDHTYFPPGLAHLDILCEQYRYKPAFIFRWSFYGENKFNPEFAARLRVNTVTNDEKLGGISSQRLINHSFHRQIPVQQYGKTNPEYFAEVKGERILEMWGGGPEPCVTHPAVIDIVTNAVLNEIEQNPDQANYSVSQNDNDKYCTCQNCQVINTREESAMGAHLAFVNEVAQRVEQKYPDKKIGTLSYWYTRKPPRTIKPRNNVQIQFADIESCRLHALEDSNCPKNRAVLADLEAWCDICDQIFVWTYATDFRYYDLPFPNLRAIGPNINYFAKKGIKGVFVQAHGGSTSGDFSDLRNYVISRCLWKPDRNAWQEVETFCELHYGQAAPVILEYLNMIHDNADKNNKHPDCFASPRALGLNSDVAKTIFDFFERALGKAEDVSVRKRVEKISITAYRSLLESGAEWDISEGSLKRNYPEQYGDIIEKYIALCKKHAMTMPNERTPFEQFEKTLKEEYAKGIPVAQIENEFWRIAVMYENNGKVVEMVYKPTGRNILGALKNNLMYGTFEEWLEKNPDQNATPYRYDVQVEKNTIILTRILPGGAYYTREIKLPRDGSQKILCKTSLTQKTKTPGMYQIIVHPEFDTATSAHDHTILSAYVKYKGKWVIFNERMINDQGPHVNLLIDATDGGGYAFFNHDAQFGVLETYDTNKIEKLRTWWVPDFELFNLELVTNAVELKRGESFTFTYAFEYLEKPMKTESFPEPKIDFDPRKYICYRTDQQLTIDGKMNESIWERAQWSEDFVDIEGELKPRPKYRTRVKMLWDDTYFYIFAEMEEPHVWAKLKQRDTVIFYDNDFEVFIDPDGDTHQYYELEINAFNTQWDLFLDKPYRDGAKPLFFWDIRGLVSAVNVRGTLNDPSDEDEGWSLEIAYPWQVLRECANKEVPPLPGDQWRVGFSRVEWRIEIKNGTYKKEINPGTGKPYPEDNWVWSPQGLINMHYPEMWGFVQFSEMVVGTGSEGFQDKKEEQAKWALRQVYYKQKRYYSQHNHYTENISDLGLTDYQIQDYSWPPRIKTSWNLFEAILESSDGRKVWSISQEGRIWRK